jgi:hypothetical protein
MTPYEDHMQRWMCNAEIAVASLLTCAHITFAARRMARASRAPSSAATPLKRAGQRQPYSHPLVLGLWVAVHHMHLLDRIQRFLRQLDLRERSNVLFELRVTRRQHPHICTL